MNGGKKSWNVPNANEPIFVKMVSRKVSKITFVQVAVVNLLKNIKLSGAAVMK
jgi:hypothetical protein